MRTSQTGIDLIKRFEGFSPVAYLCPAGVWTIGYGHTAGVHEGDSIDGDTAEDYLREDLTSAEGAVEKVCRIIKKVRDENHIADREATAEKVRTLLTNIHEDRNSRFDSFKYKGKALSDYTNPEWIEWVAEVVEGELYNDAGANNGRAYTNVKAVYANIKLDFYHRLNG